jgi:hypothetical protein
LSLLSQRYWENHWTCHQSVLSTRVGTTGNYSHSYE